MSMMSAIAGGLSYPRRALWSALGLPAHGSQLLAHLGMDPRATATRLLGAGVELAGDPLVYAGSILAPKLLEMLGGGEALGGINPAIAAELDDVLLAGVNGQGQEDESQDGDKVSQLLKQFGGG